ncbi:MAG: hypothetical protein WBD71_03320, partial [Xanthobacteraceae bacterium]
MATAVDPAAALAKDWATGSGNCFGDDLARELGHDLDHDFGKRRRLRLDEGIPVAGLKRTIIRGGLESLYFTGAHVALRPFL